jgi:glycosyltransferase involved in cell wall biosynthesis
MLRLTTRLFYRRADARVAVSREVADDLADLSGIDRAAFDVIYNPIPNPPPDLRTAPEAEALWRGGEVRILSAGSLKGQKNQALLLRSFARLRQRRPAHLVLIGDGPLRGALSALADRLGLAGHVSMPGFVTDPWPYYASADLFVLSSDYEGFGNVLVEAMRCGLPVVSTDCKAGPREILADGAYGLLVPVGDEAALAKAMEEALDRRPDADMLKRRAEELSGSRAGERYLDLMLGREP